MLTLQLPMLLALLGTALMAVVIFAPSRVPALRLDAPGAISFAPPPAPPAVARWDPPLDLGGSAADAWPAPEAPAWPALVDPRAAGCEARARRDLVEALAALGTPWAEAILRRAVDDEPDPAVREAVAAALDSRASARPSPSLGLVT